MTKHRSKLGFEPLPGCIASTQVYRNTQIAGSLRKNIVATATFTANFDIGSAQSNSLKKMPAVLSISSVCTCCTKKMYPESGNFNFY